MAAIDGKALLLFLPLENPTREMVVDHFEDVFRCTSIGSGLLPWGRLAKINNGYYWPYFEDGMLKAYTPEGCKLETAILRIDTGRVLENMGLLGKAWGYKENSLRLVDENQRGKIYKEIKYPIDPEGRGILIH